MLFSFFFFCFFVEAKFFDNLSIYRFLAIKGLVLAASLILDAFGLELVDWVEEGGFVFAQDWEHDFLWEPIFNFRFWFWLLFLHVEMMLLQVFFVLDTLLIEKLVFMF